MRKIVQVRERSKRSTLPLFPVLAILALLTALGGCGDGDRPPADAAAEAGADSPSSTAAEATTPSVEHAGYALHDTALEAWEATARRLLAGERVRSDEYERICALPAYRMSYGDEHNTELNPPILRFIMEYVFDPARTDYSDPPRRKKLYTANGVYIADRLVAASEVADIMTERNTVGRAIERAYPFIEEHRRPELLHVRLFASSPQIAWYPEDTMILDVGLALAAGPEQLEDMLAATLVRSLAPPAAPLPHEAEDGREALRSTFRKLHHEGIVNWIEDYPSLKLDVEHLTYAEPDPKRGRAVLDAVASLKRVDRMLETLLDPDSDAITTAGGSVDDLLRINRRYAPTGYAMNELIIDRLGEDGFMSAAQDGPSAWLRAYQEAALDGGARGELSGMPPFGEVVFERLLALMNR